MWHKAEWLGRLMRLELTRLGFKIVGPYGIVLCWFLENIQFFF